MEILRPSVGFEPRPISAIRSIPQSQCSAPSSRFELADFYCILQLQPNDSFMAFDLAKQLRARGRLDEALKILKSVLKIDYRFATVHLTGQVEYQLELLDEAFGRLQEAMLIAHEYEPELFELFKTIGNIFVRRGDLDSAEDSYHKAYRLEPRSDVLAVNLGALFVQRTNWDLAADHFRRAVELNSRNAKAWVGLAVCHHNKGDAELAWGNLEAAVECDPCNETAMSLVLDWGMTEKRDPRVLELIRRYLMAGGWNEKISLIFIWLCWRRGDARVARLELERLLAVNPLHAQAHALDKEMRAQFD